MSRSSEYYRVILFPEQQEENSFVRKEICKSLERIKRVGKRAPAPFSCCFLQRMTEERFQCPAV
jgi:hypothetical protein